MEEYKMKKILALIVALCCLSALFVPAMAAEDTITVYVDAPADWTEVFVYVWFDNGANSTTEWQSWPGVKTTLGDDGWYALEVPVGNNRVIANNGNGGGDNQTIDLEMDGSIDCWLTVEASTGSGMGGSVEYVCPGDPTDNVPTAPTTEPVAQELKSLALVGSGLPGIGEWVVEDAAGDMTKVSDTVYTKELAVTSGSTLTFKVAGNDAWDSGYNFGGSEDPTAVTVGTAMDMTSGNESKNLTLTASKDCTLKFTVTLKEDGTASLLVEEAEATVAPTEPEESKPEESKPEETQPSEDNTQDNSSKKGTAILVLSLVLVLLIGVAVIISIVPGKNAV
jgi:hypothetical protein